jgi:NHL repeat
VKIAKEVERLMLISSMRAVRSVVLAAVGVTLGGCWEPATTKCSDGTTCPESKVCAPAGGGCVDRAQIAACDGIDEGVVCTAPGVDGGVCRSHVCTSMQRHADVVVGDRLEAIKTALTKPAAIAVGPDGAVYLAVENLVRRIDPDGALTTIAGTGDAEYGGDGGDATSAQLRAPRGLAVDGLGQVFIADTGNHRIRRVDAAGIITTVVGTGVAAFAGDGAPATAASLHSPQGVAVDGKGNLALADTANHRIRCVDSATGIITTCAGNGEPGFGGDGGPATAASLFGPTSVVVDRGGTMYIADSANHRVRAVSRGGIITTIELQRGDRSMPSQRSP